MKKIILLLFTCAGIYSSPAQIYIVQSQKLTGQFVEIYNHTDNKENLFKRVSETSRFFFSGENELLMESIRELVKKHKIPPDSALIILFDTVMFDFARDHLWDGYTGPKEKYLPFFELYNEKLCPCIGEKLRQSSGHTFQESDMADCASTITKDTSYIYGARRIMGSVNRNELYAAAQMAFPYMYQHCAELYKFYTEAIRDISVHSFTAEWNEGKYEIDKAITRLYKTRSPELASAFPAYKKYETDLKLTMSILDQKQVGDIRDVKKNASGQLTIIKTYYSFKDDKPVLKGQVSCVLKEDVPGSPLLSLRFIPVAKMKDRDKYLFMIKDDRDILEPPPQEIIKEARIDTLQRKN
jgi:hypothetical protein